MSNYEVFDSPDQPHIVKSWTRGVPLADNAKQQLLNLAQMPFIHKWVAAMPDAHFGIGATVGSVIATKGAIIPAAVGVDLGCGMMALRTPYVAEDLPSNLKPLRDAIEQAVPHGGPGVKGSWKEDGRELPDSALNRWASIETEYNQILAKHPKIRGGMTIDQLGTLGGGNHFIEVCLDEAGAVWIMLHSGSRGVGNRIASYFIDRAKEDMRRWFINLPDQDLAYIPEGSDFFGDYWVALKWAQDFARINRELMMSAVILKVFNFLGSTGRSAAPEVAVNCHHNYVSKENHYGDNVWVTRKGAVRARVDDLGIIPGSMGAKSFIVRGKGNPESFESCSHGAGRVMSRGEARRTITAEQHQKALEGVECRKDPEVIDESPAAYKDIDAVMAAQSDLVEIVHTLKQVLCVKG